MKKGILLTLVLFFCTFYSFAQQLDSSFAGKGFVTTVFQQGNFLLESGRQALPQKDGTFIAVIEINGSTALAHFLLNGKLDSNFANKGYSQFIYISEAKAIQQSDGKILVAGREYNSNTSYNFTLVRFNADGRLDFSFGEDGRVTVDFGSDDYFSSMAVQANGNIILAGYTDNGNTDFDFAVTRYTSRGLPDTSFGTAGKRTYDFFGSADVASSAVVQPDGKIIVSGTVFEPAICPRCAPDDGRNECILVRFNTDGTADSTFGTDGKTIIDYENSSASFLAMQSDGKILTAFSNGSLMINRQNNNGTADLSFGTAGLATADFGFNEFPASVSLQKDGKIVLAALSNGFSETDSKDFAVVRFNSNGTPDRGFNGDGRLTTDFGFNEFANSAAIQEDGKIVVVGTSYNAGTNNEDFAFSRYNSNGSPDNSFSKDGKESGYYLSGNSDLYCIAAQKDDKILVGGLSTSSNNSYGFGIARYNKNGMPDAGFGKNGKAITNFETNAYINAIALQSDAKILAAGGDKLVRYNLNGSLDRTFGIDGKVSTDFFSTDIKVQKDGKIVVAGVASDASFNFSIALARYKTDGSLDAAFGDHGKVITSFFGENDQAFSVALQSDGKIVVAGHAYNRNTGFNFAVARYNTNGSPDLTFDTDGKVTTDFFGFNDFVQAMIIQKDGKIILAGSSSYDNSNSHDFALVRYNSNGSLDYKFDTDGKLNTHFSHTDAAYSLTEQSDGKIVAAGLSDDINLAEDIALARYNKDGSLDSAFNKEGKLITDLGHNERVNAALILNNKLYTAGNDLVAAYNLKAAVNEAPVVSINSPSGDSVYYTPTDVNLSALAADANGTIKSVKFYNGTTLLKTDSVSPYTLSLHTPAAGNYLFSAKAADNLGTVTSSAVVAVTVRTNIAPAVSIAIPNNVIKYTAPATFKINAVATDEDGTISKVQFYKNATLLHTETVFPYGFLCQNLPVGTYTFTAKATDNNGSVTVSNSIKIAVVNLNVAPVVSIVHAVADTVYSGPASIYLLANANDANDKISKVEFYSGSGLLKTEYFYPYSYNWSNVQPGTYTITAKATDSKGLSTTSAPVIITVSHATTISNKPFFADNETGAALKLIPNPATNILRLAANKFFTDKSATIAIISASGVAIKTFKANNLNQQINISSLASGVYTVKVVSGHQIMYGQFVKL